MKIHKYKNFFQDRAFDSKKATRKYKITDPIKASMDPFELDKTTAITSVIFRRLDHVQQVFSHLQNPNISTRLTHTYGVISDGIKMAYFLGLNHTLVEAICCWHDSFYPAYGHYGERIIGDIIKPGYRLRHEKMAPIFLEKIEKLNLTTQVTEGIKHHSLNNVDEILKESLPLEYWVVTAADKIRHITRDIKNSVYLGQLKLEQIKEDSFLLLVKEVLKNEDSVKTRWLERFIIETCEKGDFSLPQETLDTREMMYQYVYTKLNRDPYGETIHTVYCFMKNLPIFKDDDPKLLITLMSDRDMLYIRTKLIPQTRAITLEDFKDCHFFYFLPKTKGLKIENILRISID